MNLYLVQHAQSKTKEEDPQRPLSEKGRNDIRKVADFLAKHTHIQVKSIMHSGKIRSWQTAEILAEHLKLITGIKEIEGLDPLADPYFWIKRLSKTEEDLMLVGHLPHLSKLSSYLLSQDENEKIINFQQGGVVCLQRDLSGNWSVPWLIIPEILT